MRWLLEEEEVAIADVEEERPPEAPAATAPRARLPPPPRSLSRPEAPFPWPFTYPMIDPEKRPVVDRPPGAAGKSDPPSLPPRALTRPRATPTHPNNNFARFCKGLPLISGPTG